jgi:hypothetical protein
VAAAALWASGLGDEAELKGAPRAGFNNNAVTRGVASPEQAAELLAATGATIDRVQIDWAEIEPAPRQYDLRVPDAIYSADLAQGVRPLFIFAFAPAWANGGVCDSRVATCHLPPTPEHYADAARTVAMLAKRYPRLAGIEIWNEPNTAYFWAPGADPEAYAALLEASYAAIKQVDPAMPVAGGSVSSSPGTSPGTMTGADFLERIYELDAGRSMDVISIHPYPEQHDLTAETAIDLIEEAIAIRDRFGDEGKPIWVTETGMTRTGPQAVSADDQAEALVALLDRLGEFSSVKMILVHTLIEPLRSLADPERGYGILTPDLQPLPAYCALASAWSGDAC